MKKLIFAIVSILSLNLWAVETPYEVIVSRLKELDKKPNTTLFSLGKNDQGTDIMGIILGDPATATIKQLVVGTHHGNERMAAEVPFLFAEAALSSKDPKTVFYVIPVLNVTGYDSNLRQEKGADGRWYDSNRDYEDACETKADFVLKSTSLLANFIVAQDIVSAVTVHGYIGTFTFPWGTTASDYATQDDALMKDLARKAVVHNNYRIGTHGAAIYPATGAFEDWAYYKHGVWSFLLEIKNAKADLKKDALALNQFFKDAPVERSTKVGQPVNCVDRILRSAAHSHGRP